MAAPLYVVEFAGEQLPGYVQNDSRPLSFDANTSTFFGRDGGKVYPIGTSLRDIKLTFLLKSTLGAYSSGIDHLNNIMDQYRTAVAIVSRTRGENTLRIHDADRYYLATATGISMPLEATQSRSILYDVSFMAQPWALSNSTETDTFTTNGANVVAGLDDSRRTYPIFSVPSGVTGFTATDGNGHTIEFLRGTITGAITIDCGTMLVTKDSDGSNAISTMENLNFGLYYEPNVDGELDITVSGFAGSGTVTVTVRSRYEL